MSRKHSSRRSSPESVVEILEERRLLSADLTGFFTGQLPGALNAGKENQIALKVMNDGSGKASGPVTVDLFASDAVSQVALDSVRQKMNLKPGAGGTVNFRFAEPAGLAEGDYSLVAQISAPSISDANLGNDIVSTPAKVSVQQPFVDLAPQTIHAPTQAIVINNNVASRVPASVTVVNAGSAPADGTASINFYLSTDAALGANDVLAGTISARHIALKPGKTQTFRTLITAPIDTPAGKYDLFAQVLPGGGIVQKNVGEEVGLAPRQVAVIVKANPALQNVAQTFYDGPAIACTPGGTGIVQAPCDSSPTTQCAPATNATTQSSNCPPQTDCPPEQDDTPAPADDASQSQDDTPPASDTSCQSQQSTDDSQPAADDSQASDTSDQGASDQPDSSGASTSQPATDSGGDSSIDGSGDTSTDSSDGSSGSDSSDTSDDNASDSSDDGSDSFSSDDSGSDDSSSDDSGSDDSSSDDETDVADIARRSTTSSLPKINTVSHPHSSTPARHGGYKTVRHSTTGGH